MPLEKSNAHLLSCLVFWFLCPTNWFGLSLLLLPQPTSARITPVSHHSQDSLCPLIHLLLGRDQAIVFCHFLNIAHCKQSFLGYTVDFVIVSPVHKISNLWVWARRLKWQKIQIATAVTQSERKMTQVISQFIVACLPHTQLLIYWAMEEHNF